LALAATFDTEITLNVYKLASEMMRAMGVFEILGPQADIATDPRWSRANGTFGEDPALATDMTIASVTGLQSTFDAEGNDLGWGEDSVIAQIKHFPGDGAAEGGRESHQAFGMYNIYPGEGFALQTVPFFDGAFNLGTKTETAMAVMPSYSIAWGEDEEYGELVGSNFSEYKINLLRENGFDGIISTDSLIMPDNPMNIPTVSVHGMDGMNIQEVVTHMITIGIDRILMPDFGEPVSFPQMIVNAYNTIAEEEGVEVAEKNFRDSATRMLRAYILTGVFENPYASKAEAEALINESGLTSSFNEANQKSIVMLKNNDVIKPAVDGEKPTVYIAMEYSAGSKKTAAGWSLPVNEALASQYFNIVTDTVTEPTGEDGKHTENDIIRATDEQLAACDMALVFISNPSTGSGYDDATGTYLPISLQYNEYVADGDYVREESISQGIVKTVVETPYGPTTSSSREDRSYYGESTVASNLNELTGLLDLAARLPETCKICVCITASNAMLFTEFEAEVDAILVAFAISSDNFLPIIGGQIEPYGLLPIQMPANMDTVEAQYEDIPRDMEVYVDANGNAYDFAFGLNWSGVINDARVQKYNVPVVTTPVNAVIELDY
nr:glycoside hydrolase family 3 protein [Clostridia bacterium]